MDHQRIWDQLLVRGWINDLMLKIPEAEFARITGVSIHSGIALRRCPETYCVPPVRAFFATQWPSLSTWLWAQRPKDLRTDAMEQRIVEFLQSRELRKNYRLFDQRNDVQNLSRKIARDDRRIKAARTEYAIKKELGNSGHDWRTVK